MQRRRRLRRRASRGCAPCARRRRRRRGGGEQQPPPQLLPVCADGLPHRGRTASAAALRRAVRNLAGSADERRRRRSGRRRGCGEQGRLGEHLVQARRLGGAEVEAEPRRVREAAGIELVRALASGVRVRVWGSGGAASPEKRSRRARTVPPGHRRLGPRQLARPAASRAGEATVNTWYCACSPPRSALSILPSKSRTKPSMPLRACARPRAPPCQCDRTRRVAVGRTAAGRRGGDCAVRLQQARPTPEGSTRTDVSACSACRPRQVESRTCAPRASD